MTGRRGSGEGSIHKRPDGRWAAVVDLGWVQGKRRRKYLYGKTRAEVRDKLNVALHAQSRGIPLVDERQRVGAYLDWWLRESLPGTVRDSTVKSYSDLVRSHIIPNLGHLTLAKLGPQHVQGLMVTLRQQGLSARTAQYAHAVLRRALGQAERWGMVQRNVATLVDAPLVRRPEVVALTPSEARALLEAAKGDRLYALYAVAVAIGLRRGEALGLHWSDIDLDAGTLRVRTALQRINGELRFVEPKTNRSARTIPLPRSSMEALRQHRHAQLGERLAAGERWHDQDLVFPSSVGTPMEPRNLTRHFHRLCERAGIGRRRFHDLRHTCASLLLAQNVHPRVVMETLGHSGIQITMDTYSHVLPSLQREAADRMDEALGE